MTRRANRGSSLIEFALAAAFLAPLLMGAAQFLEAYRRVATLERATSQAAHAAAGMPFDSASELPSASYVRAVTDAVLAAAGPVAGFTREHVRVRMRFAADRPHQVQVWIEGYSVPLPVGPALKMHGTPRGTAPFVEHWTKTAAP